MNTQAAKEAVVCFDPSRGEKEFHHSLLEMVKAGWNFSGSWFKTNSQGKTIAVKIYFRKST